jgi:hypothetical protein
MALLFLDGFDKYGPVNSAIANVPALLTAGEWTSWTASGAAIVAGLSNIGSAVQVQGNSTATKTLAANYSRLIGGLRISATLGNQTTLMQFRDGATAQCTISLETTGIVNLRSGAVSGTILGSSAAITANSTHYLEWDITFGTSAAYAVYLDGVSVISGTGNTRAGTTNNYANALAIFPNAGALLTVDDLYLFDTTGSTNNAVLLTSPRVETTFPTSDSAVQFGFGAAILGSNAQRVTGTSAPAANSLVLRRFTPAVSCTLASIGFVPAATSATANYRPVVYADSAGAAGTLMSGGSTVTGTTTGTAVTMPLTTPQSLSAGTQYWLGLMDDTSVVLQQTDGNLLGYRAAATFTSGAPGTAPAMTSGQPSFLFWGNLTSISGNNWYEVSQQAPPGALSYVFDATVGHEDLYNFGALSVIPAHVYAVAVKAYCERSDSGAKTVSMRMKSSATDSGGTATGQTPGTTFGWLTSLFETDPNGSVAWTGAALNAATSGFHVDS